MRSLARRILEKLNFINENEKEEINAKLANGDGLKYKTRKIKTQIKYNKTSNYPCVIEEGILDPYGIPYYKAKIVGVKRKWQKRSPGEVVYLTKDEDNKFIEITKSEYDTIKNGTFVMNTVSTNQYLTPVKQP